VLYYYYERDGKKFPIFEKGSFLKLCCFPIEILIDITLLTVNIMIGKELFSPYNKKVFV
jgi:hypothetical protein